MTVSKSSQINIIQRNPVAAYYLLTLAISWAIWLPLVAMQQGWLDQPVPFSLHYLGSFGPMTAGIIITALTSGAAGLKELFVRATKWRVGWKWALVCILTPAALYALTLPVARLVNGEWPDLRLLGQVNYLPYLGIGVLPLWLATFGFGEEVGWRGFALPRLQTANSIPKATLTLGLMWVFWHIPAFFYLDTYQEMPVFILPGLIFGVLCGAVVHTWLYNQTGGSVLMIAIFHALFDLFAASEAGQGVIPMVMTAGIIAWALLVANIDRPWNFMRTEKHTIHLQEGTTL